MITRTRPSEMDLIVEPDIYSPSVDNNGNYVDKIPSFNNLKNGLRCPCGTRKDKCYETTVNFSTHIKTKKHVKWLSDVNLNRANYFVENMNLREIINSQKLLISKFDKDLHNKSLTIDYLTSQLVNKKTLSKDIDNLLEFD